MNIEEIKKLIFTFSTCDLSDGICSLFPFLNHSLLDLPQFTFAKGGKKEKVVGFAYTAEFKDAKLVTAPAPNHVDTCPPSSVLVIKTPSDAPNAVWGGLMTARATAVGIAGVVTDGRIRDADEISAFDFPVWAKGKSTMGAAPFCKLAQVGHDLILNESTPHPVSIKNGKTVLVADEHGVVCFDADIVPHLVEYCTKRVQVDALCMQDLKEGKTIVETFKARR